MNDFRNEDKLVTIKNSVDFSIVGDNILDIADFTVEKYEFRNDTTLAPEVREEAISRIKSVLWQKVEVIKLRRLNILEESGAQTVVASRFLVLDRLPPSPDARAIVESTRRRCAASHTAQRAPRGPFSSVAPC